MEQLYFFILGLIVGTFVIPLYIRFKYRKQLNNVKKILEETRNNTKLTFKDAKNNKKEIKNGMQRLIEITNEQAKIIANIQEPSKNALHSKHKQQLVLRVTDLQEEKVDIIRIILSTGYDPKVVISGDDGKPESIHLSEYLERILAHLPPPPPTTTDSKSIMRGKFHVIKGGKISH